MRKIHTWKGETQNPPHTFDVEFSEDNERGNFVAKIELQPQMWSEHYGGSPQGPCSYHEELTDNDLNQLGVRTKQTIVERGGRILTSPDQLTFDLLD